MLRRTSSVFGEISSNGAWWTMKKTAVFYPAHIAEPKGNFLRWHVAQFKGPNRDFRSEISMKACLKKAVGKDLHCSPI